jgi:hypothetical protein
MFVVPNGPTGHERPTTATPYARLQAYKTVRADKHVCVEYVVCSSQSGATNSSARHVGLAAELALLEKAALLFDTCSRNLITESLLITVITLTIITDQSGINTGLTCRHRASCILGQAFHYSPENAFYIFNQQIYFII